MSEPTKLSKALALKHADTIDSILGSFYGVRRAWTTAEETAAAALDGMGWTPARAAFIADWIENSRDGAAWRHNLAKRDGIVGVWKSVEAIEARCGAEQAAPRPPPREADPAFDAHWEQAKPNLCAKVLAVQAPWIGPGGLWEESAHVRVAGPGGVLRPLSSPERSRWCAIERGRRMKGKILPGQVRRYDGSPAFTVALMPDGRAFFNAQLAAPGAEPRTDAPIVVEYTVGDDDEFPDVGE